MAGASMKDIKTRIKSVESTMQITKAMELVASSKLRKAKERAENARPFFHTLYATLSEIAEKGSENESVFMQKRTVNTECIVLVAGDRGLAGGYNNNVFKLAEGVSEGKNCVYLPIGKKAAEYCQRRDLKIINGDYSSVEAVGIGDSIDIAHELVAGYVRKDFDEITILYTNFVSMLSQQPSSLRVLPIECCPKSGAEVLTIYEPGVEAAFDAIIPQYVSGMVYGAVCESLASELGARRMAMDSASTNAEDMISDLSLKFNRARQAAITQELTEIVSGAEAL